MSERFLILAEFPFVVSPARLALSGRPYIENYRWEPERGTRLLVVDRATGELRQTFETERDVRLPPRQRLRAREASWWSTCPPTRTRE